MSAPCVTQTARDVSVKPAEQAYRAKLKKEDISSDSGALLYPTGRSGTDQKCPPVAASTIGLNYRVTDRTSRTRTRRCLPWSTCFWYLQLPRLQLTILPTDALRGFNAVAGVRFMVDRSQGGRSKKLQYSGIGVGPSLSRHQPRFDRQHGAGRLWFLSKSRHAKVDLHGLSVNR